MSKTFEFRREGFIVEQKRHVEKKWSLKVKTDENELFYVDWSLVIIRRKSNC